MKVPFRVKSPVIVVVARVLEPVTTSFEIVVEASVVVAKHCFLSKYYHLIRKDLRQRMLGYIYMRELHQKLMLRISQDIQLLR